jgi:uncharacterized damage-inducible protein DinB
MRIVDPFLAELEQEAATTRRLLERVPGDQLAWRPHPKSMSLGQLAQHIAQTPGQIASMMAGDSFELPDFGEQPAATSTAQLLADFEADIALAKTTLNGWDDARAMASWSVIKGDKALMTMARIGFMRAIGLNHWYHHRGQLSVYLRELNVPLPSIYGPSADENPFA